MRNFCEQQGASRFRVDVGSLFLRIAILLMACFASSSLGWALSASHSPCRIRPTTFEGWKAEEDLQGAESNVIELESVDPVRAVELNQTIRVSPRATRVAIHLSDDQGVDRGSLSESEITKLGKDS